MEQEINLLELEQEHEEDSQEIEAPEDIDLSRVFEAVLFASNEPVPFKKLKDLANTIKPHSPTEVKELLDQLGQEYDLDGRAFKLEEIAQGYVLRSRPEFSAYLDLVFKNKKIERLSGSATEVLSIIAYRQPITRPQLETLRGVDSSGVIASLLERDLIEAVGKAEAPGRPTLYGTSGKFLQYFGLNRVEDLPSYQENRNRLELRIPEEKAHEGAQAEEAKAWEEAPDSIL